MVDDILLRTQRHNKSCRSSLNSYQIFVKSGVFTFWAFFVAFSLVFEIRRRPTFGPERTLLCELFLSMPSCIECTSRTYTRSSKLKLTLNFRYPKFRFEVRLRNSLKMSHIQYQNVPTKIIFIDRRRGASVYRLSYCNAPLGALYSKYALIRRLNKLTLNFSTLRVF